MRCLKIQISVVVFWLSRVYWQSIFTLAARQLKVYAFSCSRTFFPRWYGGSLLHIQASSIPVLASANRLVIGLRGLSLAMAWLSRARICLTPCKEKLQYNRKDTVFTSICPLAIGNFKVALVVSLTSIWWNKHVIFKQHVQSDWKIFMRLLAYWFYSPLHSYVSAFHFCSHESLSHQIFLPVEQAFQLSHRLLKT